MVENSPSGPVVLCENDLTINFNNYFLKDKGLLKFASYFAYVMVIWIFYQAVCPLPASCLSPAHLLTPSAHSFKLEPNRVWILTRFLEFYLLTFFLPWCCWGSCVRCPVNSWNCVSLSSCLLFYKDYRTRFCTFFV